MGDLLHMNEKEIKAFEKPTKSSSSASKRGRAAKKKEKMEKGILPTNFLM